MDANSLIHSPSFQQSVKALCLSQKESLHIGNGYASLYLQRFISEDVLKALDILYNLLALLPESDETPENFKDSPRKIQGTYSMDKKMGYL